MEQPRWSAIVESLTSRNIEACVQAAASLHAEATAEDVPRLISLLQSEDFFVREAAAWPLAELAGPSVLRELLAAYQRGFEQGHDNDGFSAALLEIPELFPKQARQALEQVVRFSEQPMKGHALWLLEFCAAERENDA